MQLFSMEYYRRTYRDTEVGTVWFGFSMNEAHGREHIPHWRSEDGVVRIDSYYYDGIASNRI